MSAYYDFNAARIDADKIPFGAQISELLHGHVSNPAGVSGTRTLTRTEVDAAVSGVTPEFSGAATPCGCNGSSPSRMTRSRPRSPRRGGAGGLQPPVRQAPDVAGQETIDRLLGIQGGSRGFGDNIPALALVTVSLRSYWGVWERHQGWIDGGLFAMSFMLGLPHAEGLGSVALNWSKAPDRDRALRQALPDLRPDEAIIMFIGFGHLPDEFHVAASPRIPVIS